MWQFKRDEIDREINIEADNSSSFKYKASLTGNIIADRADRRKKRSCKNSSTINTFE